LRLLLIYILSKVLFLVITRVQGGTLYCELEN
jgi:hypothetical protein